MNLPPTNSRIGIWGFGSVGKSAAHYLLNLGYKLVIMDSNRNVASDNFVTSHTIPFYAESEHDAFFNSCAAVVASPGIDRRACTTHKHTWIAEVDLFQQAWHKPIIAITGSVGKTTVTSMLAQLCKHNGYTIAVGGNIGTPMLDLLTQQENVDCAILEVSSFQLEQSTIFAPTIAIITNIHPNHLDRHTTMDEYWRAKATIFKNQKADFDLIVPISLRNTIQKILPASYVWYIHENPTEDSRATYVQDHEAYVEVEKEKIVVYETLGYQTHEKPEVLFKATFKENAMVLFTAMHALQNVYKRYDKDLLFDCDYVSQEHRLEHVATHNGLTYINDSKSTTPASTLAAVHAYHNRPTLLLLGGLSKGIDRKPLIEHLPPSVLHVVCFGAEATQLADWCTQKNISATACATLDAALDAARHHAPHHSVILLSPSGSSFDLYANYIERGKHFKKLVKEYKTNKDH